MHCHDLHRGREVDTAVQRKLVFSRRAERLFDCSGYAVDIEFPLKLKVSGFPLNFAVVPISVEPAFPACGPGLNLEPGFSDPERSVVVELYAVRQRPDTGSRSQNRCER